MSTDRDAWPGVEEVTQHQTDLETDLLTELKSRLADTDQKVPLDELQNAGCERERLIQLLLRIRRSVDWDRITKKQVGIATKTLEACQDQLRLLKRSELGRHIFEHLARADQLIAEVEWVITGAKKYEAQASGKKTPRSDDTFQGIIEYVKETTGEYHDEQVSMLISGAQNLSVDEMLRSENLRQWRHRRGLTSD